MFHIVNNKIIQIALLTCLLIIAIFYGYESESRWRKQVQNFNFDFYNILKPHKAGDDIVIVDIDDKSLSHTSLGQWPWSRQKLAILVDELDKLGAKVIAFDIVFSEADRSSPKYILDSIADKESSSEIKDILKDLPNNDEIFAKAIKESGNVVTGYSFAHGETRQPPRRVATIEGDNVLDLIPNYKAVASNIKTITRDVAGNGSFFVSPDVDGIIRKVPLMVTYSRHKGEIRHPYPALALEAFRVSREFSGYEVLKDAEEEIRVDPDNRGVTEIRFVKNKLTLPEGVPTTNKGEFLVYFSQPDPENWYVSALDVFSGNIDPQKIKNKIVLIGTSAVGLKDLRSTPLQPFRPGVEVHLNILDQILQKEFLYRTADIVWLERDLTFVIGAAIILITPFVNLFLLLGIVILSVAGSFYGGYYAFLEKGYLIDVLYPTISLFALFLISAFFTYMRSEAEKKQIRGAFGHYVSKDLMDELASNPDSLSLGGETRELSVMFTDIRNFTTISESLTPEELIHLMNDFLTPMSDLVMGSRGTIDKYMGDAMMAFWNAPLEDEDHARNACLTALNMNKALLPINKGLAIKAKKEGKEPLVLSAGVGINTGAASVGNMGSKQRFAYSALGDTVNLASRLEGQTKTYGVTNLIGENTYNHVKDFAALELDIIKVKGKAIPERIYTLLGTEELAEKEGFKRLMQYHNEMLARYRAGKFSEALQFINKCNELSKGQLSSLYALYEKRIGEFHANPPPADWDGVYIATSK